MVLPIRARFLANQLRELFSAFNREQSSASPRATGGMSPALPAASATSQDLKLSNYPQRWHLEPMGSLSSAGGNRLTRTQAAQQKRRVDGACKKLEASIEASRKAKSRSRCKSIGTMEGIDSDDRGRHTSVETSSISLAEDLDDLERCQRCAVAHTRNLFYASSGIEV